MIIRLKISYHSLTSVKLIKQKSPLGRGDFIKKQIAKIFAGASDNKTLPSISFFKNQRFGIGAKFFQVFHHRLVERVRSAYIKLLIKIIDL